jgi:radical SAM protein with 4Fe4S-binding SPASM domain
MSSGSDSMNQGADSLVRMTPDCSLKLLEEPAVYNRATDELYFVSAEAVPFLTACTTGTEIPDGDEVTAFVDYCLAEGILEYSPEPVQRRLNLYQSPLPSLRYLLLHVTERCNLSCSHCYQGDPGASTDELDISVIAGLIDEFESMQGLRLMVSGGEPLLHPDFWEINRLVAERDIRSILLTNGTRIDAATAARLAFNEIQVSIDGIGPTHDQLRGPGTFDQAVRSLRDLRAARKEVSIATMIHAGNIAEFKQLEEMVVELGAREWSIDQPSPTGRLADNPELLADAGEAGELLNLSFGGAIHEPVAGYACGIHLMAVMADGNIARCGFYGDKPLGTVSGGLAAAWESMERISLDELDCDCEHLAVCRGGCRFRAAESGGIYGVDPCQCYRYGVK